MEGELAVNACCLA